MGFKVDYSQTEGIRIKPGKYEVIVDSFEVKPTSKGDPMVVMDYKIREDIMQDSKGAKIRFDNFVFTENSIWKVNKATKMAAIPDGTEFQSEEHWAKTMLNRALKVTVVDREYNGKTNASVTDYEATDYPIKSALDQATENTIKDKPMPF